MKRRGFLAGLIGAPLAATVARQTTLTAAPCADYVVDWKTLGKPATVHTTGEVMVVTKVEYIGKGRAKLTIRRGEGDPSCECPWE